MDNGDTGNEPSDALILTPKVALGAAAGIAALFFLLDDLTMLSNGGGLLSVRSALRAADAGAAVINVDGSGLRTLFVFLCAIAVIIPGTALRMNLDKRLTSFVCMASIVGGGFIFDGIYDERIVGHLITSHGYSRCENGDFHVGTGKGKVWFDNYVLNQASCPSKRH